MLFAMFVTMAAAVAGNWVISAKPALMSLLPVKMTYREPGKVEGGGKVGIGLEEALALA